MAGTKKPASATPPLPLTPAGEPFGDRAQEWYEAFCSDHAASLKPSDYAELHGVAALWEAFWMTFDKQIHAEIRVKLDSLRVRLAAVEAPSGEKGTPLDELQARRSSRGARAASR